MKVEKLRNTPSDRGALWDSNTTPAVANRHEDDGPSEGCSIKEELDRTGERNYLRPDRSVVVAEKRKRWPSSSSCSSRKRTTQGREGRRRRAVASPPEAEAIRESSRASKRRRRRRVLGVRRRARVGRLGYLMASRDGPPHVCLVRRLRCARRNNLVSGREGGDLPAKVQGDGRGTTSKSVPQVHVKRGK
ncbi:hypothetical protein B296_00031800 [Ensete ventricosum]|uniref:Uncharacterized protein n=1 Tax=Ensete ventricosum TaxID=4639 RepID=A0A427A055_ENSVE|nr:hypothetical protein B296_00031800 [Ensete ventricosum]